jgi:hypothetical protein
MLSAAGTLIAVILLQLSPLRRLRGAAPLSVDAHVEPA